MNHCVDSIIFPRGSKKSVEEKEWTGTAIVSNHRVVEPTLEPQWILIGVYDSIVENCLEVRARHAPVWEQEKHGHGTAM